MIRSRSALLQHADITPRFLGHARQHHQKIFAAYTPSATASKEDSAPLKQLHGCPIQSMVSHQGLVDTPSAAGKFWRVQNHRIVLFALFDQAVQHLKSVAAFELDIF